MAEESDNSSSRDSVRPTRRTMLAGAAWAAPVIAVAVAAPAAAASTTTAADELDFYITASEVIGETTANGSVRSNGVRISPTDPSAPKIIAAGTVFTITVTYTGSNSAFSFLDTPFGVDWAKQQNPAWDIDAAAHELVFTATTTADSIEPVFGSMTWPLDPSVRPENGSIAFSGVAVIAQGGDYPDGATLTALITDPNEGTGSLTGPTDSSWPVA